LNWRIRLPNVGLCGCMEFIGSVVWLEIWVTNGFFILLCINEKGDFTRDIFYVCNIFCELNRKLTNHIRSYTSPLLRKTRQPNRSLVNCKGTTTSNNYKKIASDWCPWNVIPISNSQHHIHGMSEGKTCRDCQGDSDSDSNSESGLTVESPSFLMETSVSNLCTMAPAIRRRCCTNKRRNWCTS